MPCTRARARARQFRDRARATTLIPYPGTRIAESRVRIPDPGFHIPDSVLQIPIPISNPQYPNIIPNSMPQCALATSCKVGSPLISTMRSVLKNCRHQRRLQSTTSSHLNHKSDSDNMPTSITGDVHSASTVFNSGESQLQISRYLSHDFVTPQSQIRL